jgi:hypothetical protein
MCSPARDLSAGYHAVGLQYSFSVVNRDRTDTFAVGPFDGGRPNVGCF